MTVPYAPEVEQPDTQVATLVEAEGVAQDDIADNVMAEILLLWAGFSTASAFYDGNLVQSIAEQIARIIVIGQQEAGRLTEEHLRAQFELLGIDLPSGTIVDLPEALRLGAYPDEVYQRPAREYRYLESIETASDVALQRVSDRLEATVLTDLQHARRVAADQVLYQTDPKLVLGYRRVIHPELGNVCGLCIAAADRIYGRGNLKPIHDRCKCTELPILAGGEDPGGKLNYSDITRIYEAAGSTGSADLKRVRVQFDQNGEIGTILSPAQVKARGPAQVKRQLSDRAAKLRREQIERQIAELQGRDRLSQWHQDRLEQLQVLLDAA